MMVCMRIPLELQFVLYIFCAILFAASKAKWHLAFRCTSSYRTFVERLGTTFQIVPQLKEHLKKQNGS
jgi:hypothetical protein